MRVMCIDDTKWDNKSRCPVFGEICTIEKSFISPFSGNPVYSFVEYPVAPPQIFRCFYQKYFVPLSDIDETELVNEKEQSHA